MRCLVRVILLGLLAALLVWMVFDLSHGSHVGPTLAFSLPAGSSPSSALVSSLSPCGGTGYVKLACQDAQAAGIPPDLFVNQIKQESGFQSGVIGKAGEIGIAQFMPATAAGLGLNPHDPVASLKGAARVMASYNHRFGDYAKALAAYNAGSGTVASAIARSGSSWGSVLPPSTRRYVCTIMQELCS